MHPHADPHAGGTKVAPKAMKVLEHGLERRAGLTKWPMKILPAKVAAALKSLTKSGF